MLKKIALVLGGLLLVLIVVISLQPSQMHVERSLPMPVSPQVVHTLLNDFRAWPSWSPWEKLDPGMKRELSGAPRGVGAKYAWSGNDQVGSGNMEIIESEPEQIKIRLEFKEPFAATNTTTFALAPAPATSGGPGTRVTWAMDGENNFVSKAMGLFMDMDAMIGKDFEVGLANLGALAEGALEMQGVAEKQGVAEQRGVAANAEPASAPAVPAAAERATAGVGGAGSAAAGAK